MSGTADTNWDSKRALAIADGVDRWIQQYRMATPEGLAWGRAAEDPE